MLKKDLVFFVKAKDDCSREKVISVLTGLRKIDYFREDNDFRIIKFVTDKETYE